MYLTIDDFDSEGNANQDGISLCFPFEPTSKELQQPFDFWTMKGSGIPSNATIITPPETSSGEVAIFNDGKWENKEDHRGKEIYSKDDGSVLIVKDIGKYGDDYTELKPGSEFDEWKDGAWVKNIDREKESKIADNSALKKNTLTLINQTTQAWQSQLILGIISDQDKSQLKMWMEYYKIVQDLDESDVNMEIPKHP